MSSSLFEISMSVQSHVSAAKRASHIVDTTMHVFVRPFIYCSYYWITHLMALLHPPHYFASTETVPADSLTWSTVSLAKFVPLSSLASVKRLWTKLMIVSTIAVLLDSARMAEADAVLMMMYGSLSALVGAYFGFSSGVAKK